MYGEDIVGEGVETACWLLEGNSRATGDTPSMQVRSVYSV